MRLFLLCAVFLAAGVLAFALALSGLGIAVNTAIFAAAAGGLLFTTVNLTSAKRAAQVARESAANSSADAAQ